MDLSRSSPKRVQPGNEDSLLFDQIQNPLSLKINSPRQLSLGADNPLRAQSPSDRPAQTVNSPRTLNDTGSLEAVASDLSPTSKRAKLINALPQIPRLSREKPQPLTAKILLKLRIWKENTLISLEVNRLAAKKFMTTHWLGVTYTWMMMLVSVAATITYIQGTEYDERLNPESVPDSHSRKQANNFKVLELVFSALILVEWAVLFFLADHKTTYLISFLSIVDICIVISVFVTLGIQCPNINLVTSFSEILRYAICGLKTVRILRFMRLYGLLVNIQDLVHRAVMEMLVVTTAVLLIGSSMIQYLEADQFPRPFHTWVYFMWITIATVGYGDVTPVTMLGRFYAMFIILVAVVIIPKLVNDLLEKIQKQSVYQRVHYQNKTNEKSHVLVCGDLSSVFLEEFFAEIFHEDHGSDNQDHLHVVILQPFPPNHEMLAVLRHPVYSFLVTYLEGSALSAYDLMRAKALSAASVLVMGNKYAKSLDDEDARSILAYISIKKFIALNPHHKTSICVQLMRKENQRHILAHQYSSDKALLGESTTANDENTPSEDIIVSVNQIKMGVIAKSVIYPGTSTLIMNLLTSFSEETEQDAIGSLARRRRRRERLNTDEDEVKVENGSAEEADNSWKAEYRRGCSWEVYTTVLSDIFVGIRFAQLSEILYQKLGVLLFAIEVEDKRTGKHLLLNPSFYIIPPESEARVIAFVMAENNSQGDLSFATNLSQDTRYDDVQLSLLAGDVSKRLHTANSAADQSSKVEPDSKTKTAVSWRSLVCKSDTCQTTALEAEAQQKKQEAHLRKAHFLRTDFEISDTRAAGVDIEDVIVHTSVTEEIKNIKNHLIIVANSKISHLFDLLLPLRARHCSRLSYIVLLYPHVIPAQEWRQLSQIPGLLMVLGSGLEEKDIIRAGIFRAADVIILADLAFASLATVNGQSAAHAVTNESLVDADAIFSYQCVTRLNENVKVVVEIIRHSNIRYLADSGADNGYHFSPLFASGTLFTSQIVDNMMCQALHNPRIIGLVDMMVSASPYANTQCACHARAYNPACLMHASCFYQIPLPNDLESKTFGALFSYLSKRGIIPLALYRGVYSQLQVGPKGNKLPYVFTNPHKDTELYSCDRVFVLSPQLPKDLLTRKKGLADKEVEYDDMVIKDMLKLETDRRTERLHTQSVNMGMARRNCERDPELQAIVEDMAAMKRDLMSQMAALALKIDSLNHSQSPSTSTANSISLGNQSPEDRGRSTLHILGSGGFNKS